MPSEQDALGVGGATKQENLEQVYYQFNHQGEIVSGVPPDPFLNAFGEVGQEYITPVVNISGANPRVSDWDDFITRVLAKTSGADPLGLSGTTEADWLNMFVAWYRGVALANADPVSFSEDAINVTSNDIEQPSFYISLLTTIFQGADNNGAISNWPALLTTTVNDAFASNPATDAQLRFLIGQEIRSALINANVPAANWPTGYNFLPLDTGINQFVNDNMSTLPLTTPDVSAGRFDQYLQGTDVNTIPIGGDWNILNTSSLGTVVTPSDIGPQFINMFNDFVQSKEYLNATPNNGVEFFEEFSDYLARAVVLQSANKEGANVPTSLASSTVDDVKQSFEDVYNKVLPGRTQQQFTKDLAFFFQNRIAERGFFVPSQEMDNWTSYIDSIEPLFAGTLSTIGSEKVLVLDRIFTLVSLMIDVLQKLAAVQANRLFFLTKWQKAYTEAINEIHVFIGGNDAEDWTGIRIDGDNEASAFAAMRTELNQLNTSFKERLTANRQVVADDAKAHQSAVNQSNDAVTQQSNIATAILQQLSTILGSVFR